MEVPYITHTARSSSHVPWHLPKGPGNFVHTESLHRMFTAFDSQPPELGCDQGVVSSGGDGYTDGGPHRPGIFCDFRKAVTPRKDTDEPPMHVLSERSESERPPAMTSWKRQSCGDSQWWLGVRVALKILCAKIMVDTCSYTSVRTHRLNPNVSCGFKLILMYQHWQSVLANVLH